MAKIIYLAHIFDGVNILSIILLVVSIIVIVGAIIQCFVDLEEGEPTVKDSKLVKNAFVIAIISALLVIFVPNEKTYLTMVGVDGLEKIVTNDVAKEIGGKTLDLVNKYLDEKLSE